MPTTTTVVIVGPNLPREAKATFHVHAAGCADLKRGWIARHAAGERPVRCASEQDVVEYVYADMIDESDAAWSDYASEFHYAPCVTFANPDEALTPTELRFMPEYDDEAARS